MKKKGEFWVEVEEDEDVYSEDWREMLVENDELSAEEEGFMRGYDSAA